LFVRDIAPELVGEVEPKLAERMVQIKRDRRLDETRANSRVFCQATHIGQSPRKLVALSEEQLEGFCGNVIPCHAVAPAGLLRELEPAGVSVQRVWHEVAAQPPSRGAASERLEPMLRGVGQRCSSWRERRVVVTGTSTAGVGH
jgi:hypothetical protein